MERSIDRSELEGSGKKRIGIIPVIIFLLLALLLLPLVFMMTNNFGFASSLLELFISGSPELIDEDGMRLIDGDYTIDAPGERLEKTHITGNLYLASGIGDGSVELVEVAVDGAVLVQGGGFNTIRIIDCIFDELKVNRPDGRVRLIASGKTGIRKTILESGVRLLENLSAGFEGFEMIEVVTAEQVELIGSFESVHIALRDANVEIESEHLEELVVVKTAGGSALMYPDGMTINRLYLDGTAYLLGRGEIDQAYLAGSGITELVGIFNQVYIASEAGHFDLKKESVFEELVVSKGALNNVLNIEENVTVVYLELNEAVEINGEGSIEEVLINAPGSSLEQIPLEIEFAREVSVFIAGHEISSPAMLKALRDNGKPGQAATTVPAPAPAPAPAPTPAPATTIPAPAPKPEPAPEPQPQPEPEEDLVKDFIVEAGLTPGKKLVVVTLTVSDPQNYKVKVGNTNLAYNAEARGFWGEVDSEEALRSKVIVSR